MLPAFDCARFEQERKAFGTRIGTPMKVFDSVASTSDEAKRAARAGAPAGALFLAEHQTRGRGRGSNRWRAGARESLLFSVVLRPRIPIEQAPPFALVVGLAAREVTAGLVQESPRIKWPNDLLLGKRKLGGILVESQVQGCVLSALVVGVGFNVNVAEFPDELAGSATSLLQASGKHTSREVLLANFLAALEARTAAYENSGLVGFLNELRDHDALLGERVAVAGRVGIASGIAADGALLLRDARGLTKVTSGSVERVES